MSARPEVRATVVGPASAAAEVQLEWSEAEPGWRLAVFTANDRLAKEIRLKRRRVTAFFNGSLKCRMWEFEPAG